MPCWTRGLRLRRTDCAEPIPEANARQSCSCRPQQRQDHTSEGLPRIGAQCQRGFIQRFVQLAHRGDARPHADGHVAEDEADDKDDTGAGDLDRRHVEGQDIADADDRTGDGEAEHRAKLERVLSSQKRLNTLVKKELIADADEYGGTRRSALRERK